MITIITPEDRLRDLIRDYVIDNNINIREFAKIAGLNYKTVYDFLNNGRNTTTIVIRKIQRVLKYGTRNDD